MANRPKTEDYILPVDPDDKGFTIDPTFHRRHTAQREKVEQMESEFLEELKQAFRANKSKLARDFLEYSQNNPGGNRAKAPAAWGGDVGPEFTGIERNESGDDE